jgi:ABC-type uncharacterized transport system involved in gliding motility auxiliary subunit
MKLSFRISQHPSVKNLAITAVLLACLSGLAFLTYRYNTEFDATANNNNTLSEGTRKVLTSLPDTVLITVYIKTSHPLKRQIKPLLERYRRHKANIKIQFVDPEVNLAKARELGVGSQGLIVVEYHGNSEKINFLDESTLTNALLQLANHKERWVSFLTGHGERSATGVTNFDLGNFAKELKQRNINSQPLNLAEIGAIPDNSAVLVLAAPRVPLLAGELGLIQNYIQQGGNLLLLTDPDDKYLTLIEQSLGIHKLPGILVDTSSKLYGIDDPSFVLVSQYGRHPITQGMENITVYPQASALAVDKRAGFDAVPILNSIERSWTETSEIKGEIRFDKNSQERQGPLPIAYALTREIKGHGQQRIVVVGDGDFLSNTFLGNVGNMEMGMRIFNWLTHDDQFVNVPLKNAVGKSLQLSPTAIGMIGFGFLLVLPLALMATGFWIWRSRKQR